MITCGAPVACLAVLMSLLANLMPHIVVDNGFDSRIEITPVDEAHKSLVPISIANIVKRLPPGSFIIANHTSEKINAIVAQWSYNDQNGITKPLRVNCDGYIASPVEAIVDPNSTTLVTPYSCTKEEFFSNLEPNALFGSPLDPAKISTVPSPESISEVHVLVDSVIFSDGEIWGQDKFNYSSEIEERYFAAQEVVSEATAARELGERLSTRLARIHDEARERVGRRAFHRANYAALVQRSPNPDGTIESLRGMTRPHFHRASEGTDSSR